MSAPNTVTKIGNMLVVRMDDNTEFQCVPVGYGVWLANNAAEDVPPPEPSAFKFPFPRAEHTTYSGHSGVDWPGGGKTVRAIGAGVVQRVYAYSGNTYPGNSSEPVWRGNCVVIDHGNIDSVQIWSLYAHMASAPAFAEGDAIAAGQEIGTTGNTGYSNGSHLHFEVIYNGVRLSQGQGGYERTIGWMDANASGSW